jgi:hypothetical protein
MIEHSVSAFHSGLSLPIRASSKARKHRTWVLPSWGARLELSHRRLLWMTSTRVVQEMLEYANIRQTMDTYSPVVPNMQQQTARARGRDAGLKSCAGTPNWRMCQASTTVSSFAARRIPRFAYFWNRGSAQ